MKLTELQKQGVLHLLSYMSEYDTLSLARTITNSLIPFDSVKDAQNAIILHEVNLQTLLSRRKVTREIIFKCLNSMKIDIASNCDKLQLTNKLLQIWEQQITVPPACSTAQSRIQDNISEGDIDTLAERFALWFYSILNDHTTSQSSDKLCVHHFWNDCSLHLVMQSPLECVVKDIRKDSESVVNVLRELQSQHKLYFNPNVSYSGVRGKIEAHGHVLVVACGTLHQVNNCVGVFQQIFCLIRDPFMQNNWRIKSTTIVLRSEDISKLPELDQECFNSLSLPQ